MALAPLCQAQEIDYVLLALYAALAALIVVQMIRLWCHFLSNMYLAQHSLLLLCCLLRFVYLIMKPVIDSLAALVALGLLPFAISLFVHPLIAVLGEHANVCPQQHVGLAFHQMSSAFSHRHRVCVCGNDGDCHVGCGRRRFHAIASLTYGSYVLAALYAVVCIFVLIAGVCTPRPLSRSTAGAVNWKRSADARKLASASLPSANRGDGTKHLFVDSLLLVDCGCADRYHRLHGRDARDNCRFLCV